MTALTPRLEKIEKVLRLARTIDGLVGTVESSASSRMHLRRVDEAVGAAVQAYRHPMVTHAAITVTQLGSWMTHVGVMTAAVVTSRRRRSLRPLVYTVTSMSGCSAFYTAVKTAVDRTRPDAAGHLVLVRDSSFPSGHAATAAAGARTVAELYDLPKAPAALLAGTVAATRVYLGVHHPSDVIVGFLIGWIWASVAAAIVSPNAAGEAESERGGVQALTVAPEPVVPEPAPAQPVDEAATVNEAPGVRRLWEAETRHPSET